MIFERNVYFLRPVGERGPIKIGSSMLPINRLKAVQIWSPVLLEIVAFVRTHQNTEVFLHRHFRDSHRHGEWFEWSDELQSLMDHCANHDAMPGWVTPPKNPKEWKAMREKYPRGLRRPSHANSKAA